MSFRKGSLENSRGRGVGSRDRFDASLQDGESAIGKATISLKKISSVRYQTRAANDSALLDTSRKPKKKSSGCKTIDFSFKAF